MYGGPKAVCTYQRLTVPVQAIKRTLPEDTESELDN